MAAIIVIIMIVVMIVIVAQDKARDFVDTRKGPFSQERSHLNFIAMKGRDEGRWRLVVIIIMMIRVGIVIIVVVAS